LSHLDATFGRAIPATFDAPSAAHPRPGHASIDPYATGRFQLSALRGSGSLYP